MASPEIDHSAIDAFEPIELLQLPETHSYRSLQSSSLEVDRDNHGLLKSTPTVHSALTKTKTDKGFLEIVKSLRQRLHGWRFGVLLSSAMASFVLVVNCVSAITIHSKYGTDDGLSTAFEGDCSTANQWSLALHIAINVFSSLLLGASNYTMQVLNAPTRAECDKAHAQGDWLDIGVTSFRNIVRVTWPRRVLFLLLGFSSVPIHLLYNSAAFRTIDANAYVVVVTTPLFLQSNASLSPQIDENQIYPSKSAFNESETLRQAYFTHQSAFMNLSAAECIKTYGVDFVTGHSNVIAVIAERHPVNPSFRAVIASEPKVYATSVDSYAWMCAESGCTVGYTCHNEGGYLSKCNVRGLKADSSQWRVYDHPIGYCLARKAEPHCKLQFSRDILITVIACNLCKAAAMMATLFLQHKPALMTTGDAISSWLERPDEVTVNRCLQSARRNVHTVCAGCLPADGRPPVTFNGSGILRWHQAISRKRWAAVLTLCSMTLGIAGVLLGVAHDNLRKTRDGTAQTTGFGAITSKSIIRTLLPPTGAYGLLANVLVANSPQLIFSCLYLLYNGLFTSMCLAHEYCNYSIRRKSLRVTSPRGDQRSTHWLHLPYVYSVPLLAASIVLHWSVSQSIFFVGIDAYKHGNLEWTKLGLGFSVQPVILDIVLGSCMLLVLVGMGFRKLHGKIPLANSNSYAISAACHPPKEDTDAALKPVMWGEVQTRSGSEVGHCCFTSMEVTAPVEGRMYAGLRKREGVY